MKFIIGKKVAMTQVWQGDKIVPVTKIQAGPCLVTQVKDEKKDKYLAVQLAFGIKKEKNIKKPQIGHLKKAGLSVFPRDLHEFRLEKAIEIKNGDTIDAGTFTPGDIVKVAGTSKGKGFQGVVRKYHFSGSKKTHGNKDQERMPGSSGATGPQHVFKGARRPGRMGGENVSVTNLEIIDVDSKNNIILIKGAVPGVRDSLLFISGSGELKFAVKGENEKADKPAGDKEEKADLGKSGDENIEKVIEEAHEKIISK